MEELILPIAKHTCMNIIKDVIEELGWKIEESKENVIKASTGFSIRSWGEVVTISIKGYGIDKIRLIIKSKPRAQAIDWGKSRENEIIFKETVLSFLKDGDYI